MSGRVNQAVEGPFAPLILPRVEGAHAPFVGITTDGEVRTGLRSLDGAPRVPTAPIADAALAFVQALTPTQRSQACLPMDSPDWRAWTNVHVAFWRHGVMLDDARPGRPRPRARHPANDVVRRGATTTPSGSWSSTSWSRS